MKKFVFTLLLFSSIKSFAQISFNDFYTIIMRINSPYAINQGGYIDARDTLQTRGYVLTYYHRDQSPNSTGDAFLFIRNNIDNEKVGFNSIMNIQGTQRTFIFIAEARTTDLDLYNSWLRIANLHPDFIKSNVPLSPFSQQFDTRPSVGRRLSIVFDISHGQEGNTQTAIKPLSYTMTVTIR